MAKFFFLIRKLIKYFFVCLHKLSPLHRMKALNHLSLTRNLFL